MKIKRFNELNEYEEHLSKVNKVADELDYKDFDFSVDATTIHDLNELEDDKLLRVRLQKTIDNLSNDQINKLLDLISYMNKKNKPLK